MAHLTLARLKAILARAPEHRVLLVGDYFLDRYLTVDPNLAEISIETGRIAHQVTALRCSPGAAGTVAANLHALKFGRTTALGIIGDDGDGFDLLRALNLINVDTESVVVSPLKLTPCYAKPMATEGDEAAEMDRFDTRSRTLTPPALVNTVISRLVAILEGPEPPHAVVVADQITASDEGVVTGALRQALTTQSRLHPEILFFADSRARIQTFVGVVTKPNLAELRLATHSAPDCRDFPAMMHRLTTTTHAQAFATDGDKGIYWSNGTETAHSPAVRRDGPVDVVGAGDSATAGLVCGLLSGGTPIEAAILGCLSAGVTVRKLGTTGTANPDEVIELATASGLLS